MPTNRRKFTLIHYLLLGCLALAGCSPGTAGPTPTPGGGGAAPPPESGVPAAQPDADTSAPAEGNPQAGEPDAVTGLPQPPLQLPPVGASIPPAPPASAGTAMLVIGGDLPLVLTGGECQTLDNDTYLSIPNTFDPQPPYASLIIYAGDTTTRSGTLVWATSAAATDGAVVSTNDVFVITLNEDGFSGRFDGTAQRVTNNVPVLDTIQVSGVFTCVASLITIRGDHPVDLAGAQCELEPQFAMRAGERGQNQALLILEAGTLPGDTGVRAGISWQVNGVTYTSTWLSANRNPDGLSGSYYGQAAGPDGVPFDVQGTFNCLGG